MSEPFHGGMEAHTGLLAHQLMSRGHRVSIFAAPGSDVGPDLEELPVGRFEASELARQDAAAMPDLWMREHHAYLGLMLDLARSGGTRFDVVHNNSLHHLPVAMADMLSVPVVTTLHTPPVPWLESAVALCKTPSTFVAVSRHTAAAWRHAVRAETILNGVDTNRWVPGPGGRRAVWTGRIVPEKAPHLAIHAALEAGLAIDLAGPCQDEAYFVREVEPLLGERVRHLGHLGTDALVDLVGGSSVAIVSPVWDEPFGLVAAEAMACGTPVAAFRRGALPEIVVAGVGEVAEPDDVGSLSTAIKAASICDRSDVRAHAVRHLSADRMVSAYEQVYRRLCNRVVAA